MAIIFLKPSSMDADLQSQIDRADELFLELEKCCNADLAAQVISDKTRNLAQEVLLKIRHALDQALYKFFVENYKGRLSVDEFQKARVYFPIVKQHSDLRGRLGSGKMLDMDVNFPDFLIFLEKCQPYNSGYSWLADLSHYANEKHTRLTPQKKIEEKRVTIIRDGGSVSWGSGVSFGSGVRVIGIPIDPKTQIPVPNNLAETKIERWVSFLFEDSGINVLWLCKKAVEDGEKIISELLRFVNKQ